MSIRCAPEVCATSCPRRQTSVAARPATRGRSSSSGTARTRSPPQRQPRPDGATARRGAIARPGVATRPTPRSRPPRDVPPAQGLLRARCPPARLRRSRPAVARGRQVSWSAGVLGTREQISGADRDRAYAARLPDGDDLGLRVAPGPLVHDHERKGSRSGRKRAVTGETWAWRCARGSMLVARERPATNRCAQCRHCWPTRDCPGVAARAAEPARRASGHGDRDHRSRTPAFRPNADWSARLGQFAYRVYLLADQTGVGLETEARNTAELVEQWAAQHTRDGEWPFSHD